MRSWPIRHTALVVLVAALTGLPATAAGPQETSAETFQREVLRFREEREQLEIAIQLALRRVPTEPETDRLEARIRHLAGIAELEVDFRALDPGEIPALPDGSPGPLRLDAVELSGRGELDRIGSLLALLAAGDPRLRDLESLAIEVDAGGPRFVARLLYPTWTGAVSPPATAGGFAATLASLRAEVETLRAQRLALDAWSARALDGRLPAAAALVDALAGLDATAVTRLGLDDRVEIAGATLGVAAREALAESIAGAGFTIAATGPPSTGACRPFALALAARGPRAAHFPTPTGAPAADERTAALCAFEPDPAVGKISARGDAARSGAFTLRARGLDLADLLRLLYETTAAGFVVDPDVRGRIDADLEGVTLDEALATLAPLGLAIGPEPIRRVSRGSPGSAAPGTDDWTGEPATFAFKRLALTELLCLFDRAFSLPSRVEPGLATEVTIFASAQPWDLVLARTLESAGLAYAIVDGSAHIASPERIAKLTEVAWLPSCEASPAAAPTLASHPQQLGELGADDLTLAAITASAAGVRASVYAAFGRLHGLEPGVELQDATVETLEADGVRLRSAGGRSIRLGFER